MKEIWTPRHIEKKKCHVKRQNDTGEHLVETDAGIRVMKLQAEPEVRRQARILPLSHWREHGLASTLASNV